MLLGFFDKAGNQETVDVDAKCPKCGSTHLACIDYSGVSLVDLPPNEDGLKRVYCVCQDCGFKAPRLAEEKTEDKEA